ncbi:hypothetical protein FA15DRAFT_603116 [Coprinopsis marcescibilis]|uniref:Uncharacterized protein n=1 Tax=Coprinopsis marcescibilis TaxID=230819 RepID=A0A5C3KS02_COPMA|nr:hypothetical protein FA15DRAFT_603116 [Coprinopsis marcescibilis]
MLHKSRLTSARQFEERFRNTIRTWDFKPGTLVLVRNSRIDSSIGYKTKPRYLGPMVVVRRASGGSYILAELDGSISKLRFAAYRVIPYIPRDIRRVPVTTITDIDPAALEDETFDREDNTYPEDDP